MDIRSGNLTAPIHGLFPKIALEPRHGTSPQNTKPRISHLKVDKRDNIEHTAILYSLPVKTTPIQSFKT